MKCQLISIAIAASTVLAAIRDVQAMPPRKHSVNGVIETIDWASRTPTLKSKDGAAPLTFVWNDNTRFSHKGGCAKCSFESGQTNYFRPIKNWASPLPQSASKSNEQK